MGKPRNERGSATSLNRRHRASQRQASSTSAVRGGSDTDLTPTSDLVNTPCTSG